MKAKSYRQKVAQVHAALGHARRLRIIEVLEESPNGMSFEQIGKRCKINASTLGFHIKCLLHAGLLSKTIKGPYSIYKFDPAPLGLIAPREAFKRAA